MRYIGKCFIFTALQIYTCTVTLFTPNKHNKTKDERRITEGWTKDERLMDVRTLREVRRRYALGEAQTTSYKLLAASHKQIQG